MGRCVLTSKEMDAQNQSSPLVQENRQRIDRVKRILESWIGDALVKPDFKGSVIIEVHIASGMIHVVEPSLQQTLRNFDD